MVQCIKTQLNTMHDKNKDEIHSLSRRGVMPLELCSSARFIAFDQSRLPNYAVLLVGEVEDHKKRSFFILQLRIDVER